MIPDLRDTILNTWRTSNRVTVFLIEHLPAELWSAAIPGAPRRAIRMIAGHLHNSRCMWIRTLGLKQGIPVPRSVDRRRVARRELVPALQRSSRDILQLLTLACDRAAASSHLRLTSGAISPAAAGTLVWAPAGVPHGVDETLERTVLLIAMAPPPA